MTPTASGSPSIAKPMAVLTTLFFMWGFMTVMNDMLIPHLKAVFTLSWWQSMLVQFCFFGAYFLGSLGYYLVLQAGKGDPIQRIGYKRALVAGPVVECLGQRALCAGHVRAGLRALFPGPCSCWAGLHAVADRGQSLCGHHRHGGGPAAA
jgi:fucose permease